MGGEISQQEATVRAELGDPVGLHGGAAGQEGFAAPANGSDALPQHAVSTRRAPIAEVLHPYIGILFDESGLRRRAPLGGTEGT